MQEGQTIMAYYNKAENLNSQCIKAISANTDKNQFIFCTNSINKENKIHYIDYNEDSQRITQNQIYQHNGILHDIYPSLDNQSLAFLAYSESQNNKLKLLDFNNFEDKQINSNFEVNWDRQILSINYQQNGKIIITDEQGITLYDYQNQKTEQKIDIDDIQKSKIDPHHDNIVSTIQQNDILINDLRSQQKSLYIKNAHNQQVFDIDFNSNKQNYVMSCGQDYSIKFWDVRKTTCPLKIISDLNNWPLNCLYNHYHDQLVLSSYDDGSINLHKIVSTSSATIVDEDKDIDQLIKNYDEYDDSVQSLAWSAASAWLFASISYSGNVIINQVPTNEKYKILL